MDLHIKFVCEQCWKFNRTRHENFMEYRTYEWDNLTDAIKHLNENPEHKITAETELDL